MSARHMTWAMLQARPIEQQIAYWRALVARWEGNAEREADDDVAFDRLPERWEVSR
jgi:hypothetical protein